MQKKLPTEQKRAPINGSLNFSEGKLLYVNDRHSASNREAIVIKQITLCTLAITAHIKRAGKEII